MALTINTNIASLNAQNNLNKSQDALNQALSRLSSGLRINSPADDPAGYSIAQRMTAQVNGFNQAVRNANDGISFAQVANGALNTVTDALQSIRTLAVQAANSTNSAQDRQALNSEVQQSIAEVNSTAQDTQFNGQSILNGSLGSLVFQVGANAGQTISVNGFDVRGQNLGAQYGDGASINTSNLTNATGTIEINNVAVDLSGSNGSVSDVVAAINNVSSQSHVYAQRADVTSGTIGYTSGASGTVSIDGVTVNIASGASSSDVAAAINAYTTQTGVTAVTGASGTITLTDDSGADITVSGSGGVTLTSGGTIQAGVELYTSLGSSNTITLSGNTTTLSDIGLSGSGVDFTSLTSLSLNSTNVLTYNGAKDAIKAMDFALSQLSNLGGQLGALQSRFQSTISNLQSASQNTVAAQSRIQDADFAAETANLSRAQILQQAGVAMVAQANSQPQLALSLLK